jgi:osmotically-inducible protein OsmY
MTPKSESQSDARPDAAIAWDIRQALKFDSDVPDERISVQVHDGLVTLEGNVEARLQKEAAEPMPSK